MYNRLIIFILIFFAIAETNKMYSQVSPRVSMQGTLKDANGAAAKDSVYNLTFKLYNQAVGGTVLWSESASVEVSGGIYSHYLGSVVPLNTSDFSSTLFLGVVVGSIELSPRTELSYAPYAFAVFNSECSGSLGDIKYSMLNPAQFALENGSCLVPMDGRSIAGSALGNLMNINAIPDGGGLFLRAQEFPGMADRDPNRTPSSPIAVLQDQAILSHGHSLSDPGHGHNFNDNYRQHAGEQYPVAGPISLGSRDALASMTNSTNNASTGISINSAGGTETRPINVNAWIYIRIN